MTSPSIGAPVAPRVPRPPRPSGGALGRPVLAAVRLDARADGVAYASRLIHLALHEIGADARPVELSPRAASRPSAFERLRFLGRLTSAQARADWVLFTHLGLARAQRLVPDRWSRPYAIFLHGIEVWDRDLSADRRIALQGARLRLSNSRYTARRVMAAHPDVGTVAACPLALHPDDVRGHPPAATPSPILAGLAERCVVIIGRMSAAERYKGHDELIECWPAVVREVPDAQLVVVGTGDDRDRLRRKASETLVGDRILFPGYVDDATRDLLLARAALFAMPSRGEGFGIVYLQAMRAGTPCVGSLADAAGDVIADGETGRLVDPSDRQALATTIAGLLRDAPGRHRMGEAGRRRYEREFTFDRFRDRLADLLGAAFPSSPEVG